MRSGRPGAAGIGWRVVQVWPDADRRFERKLHNRHGSRLCPPPLPSFLVIEPGRLGHRADVLGMAICPLSLMIWGVLLPSAPGAPRSRDRSLSAVRE